MIPAPAPGLYENVPADVYRSWDALNASTLNLFRQYAPARARHMQLHPSKPTPAKLLGTAVHMALLEPDDFDRYVVVRPKGQRGEKRESFDRMFAGCVILSEDDYELALRMRDAVLADPEARALLEDSFSGFGKNELSIVWDHPILGIPCKARLDRLVGNLIIDVKTDENAHPDAFGRAIEKYGYHIAAAWYYDGFNCATGNKRSCDQPGWNWLVIEKEPPHLCAVYPINALDFIEGRSEGFRLASLYADCLQKNEWPGYANCSVQRPPWARGRLVDEYPLPETEDW